MTAIFSICMDATIGVNRGGYWGYLPPPRILGVITPPRILGVIA